MTALKNKIRRIQEIVALIENAQNVTIENQTDQVIEEVTDTSELLLLQINSEENEFLFI
ncbi:hypothetical protein [Flavobacterium suncheonense]|uniref:hypothetical protein n=1 Tax=Flavobacterium suncheonense TaxID=350894 RepID=UPI0003FA231E|nr:hypothetical protein [Flavobacterium suncheonense]